jgi:small-conductance mechanosensitive channel
MPVRIRNYMKFFVAAFLLVSCCLVEADAQTRKKRTRRSTKPAAPKPVITNPPIAPAETTATGDVKIISTADETDKTQKSQEPEATASPATKSDPSQDEMQKTINNLSNQVNRLNDKLSDMSEDDRYHLDMERLTRAEQRSEQLRSQLLDTESKMADIESKLEQIEYALKPENIDRATQGYGSLRPEEARDTRRRQLEGERGRLKAQYGILQTSKARLQTASANADSEVDLLRAKLQQRREQMDAQPAGEKRTRKP